MESLGNSFLVVLALLLVLLNGFFVAAEFSMVKLRSTRVQELRRAHGLRGEILFKVHRNLDTYLSACQLGITLSSLGLGWIGEPAFARILQWPLQQLGINDVGTVHSISFVFAFSVISYLHIVIGELAPKSLALRKPEATSLWTGIPLYLFFWVMYPFIWVLNASANRALGWFGVAEARHGHDNYSPAELRVILHMNRAAAEGPNSEVSHWLSHAMDLPGLTVGELMRPWREAVTLAADDSYLDVRRAFLQQRYSRYPLLDAHGEPVAVVHMKDALLLKPGESFALRLREQAHPLIRVREDNLALGLLQSFRRGASHFALVQDHAEHALGFLTMEDILEALLGDITDEHESGRTQQVQRRILELRDGSWIARGDTPLFLVERLLGQPLPGGAAHNRLTGWLMERLDHVPRTGDRVRSGVWRFEVQAANGPVVARVRICPVETP